MKKNMNIVLIILGVVILATLVLLFLGFRGRKKQIVLEPVSYGNIDEKSPLFALTDTKEEAEDIAEFYDIEFISFADGVATYYTDKNLSEIIKKSNEDNNPRLYLNHKRSIHSTDISVQ